MRARWKSRTCKRPLLPPVRVPVGDPEVVQGLGLLEQRREVGNSDAPQLQVTIGIERARRGSAQERRTRGAQQPPKRRGPVVLPGAEPGVKRVAFGVVERAGADSGAQRNVAEPRVGNRAGRGPDAPDGHTDLHEVFSD